jgi:hypothetical protein
MDTDITDEVELASFLSEPETGDAVLRAANTTTLRRMSTACAVVLPALVPQLWLIRLILLPWHHHRSMAWDQVQWPVLQDLLLTALVLPRSALAQLSVNHHHISMECPLAWVAHHPLLSLKWAA